MGLKVKKKHRIFKLYRVKIPMYLTKMWVLGQKAVGEPGSMQACSSVVAKEIVTLKKWNA